MYLNGVAPILDYCSGVWGYGKYHHIKSVQHRALRYFLGVHRYTPILAIQGDSGWFSSSYRHQLNIIRLWNRLLTLPDDRLTKKVFLWDLEQLCNNNWSQKVKLLLDSLDMSVYFLNRMICNVNTVDEKLRHKFVNIWTEELQTLPKLRTYRTLKSYFETEKYVTMDIPKGHRSILAQFRCGVLPIRIETGQYRGGGRLYLIGYVFFVPQIM